MGGKIYQYPVSKKVKLAREIISECLKYNQRIPEFICKIAGYKGVI